MLLSQRADPSMQPVKVSHAIQPTAPRVLGGYSGSQRPPVALVGDDGRPFPSPPWPEMPTVARSPNVPGSAPSRARRVCAPGNGRGQAPAVGSYLAGEAGGDASSRCPPVAGGSEQVNENDLSADAIQEELSCRQDAFSADSSSSPSSRLPRRPSVGGPAEGAAVPSFRRCVKAQASGVLCEQQRRPSHADGAVPAERTQVSASADLNTGRTIACDSSKVMVPKHVAGIRGQVLVSRRLEEEPGDANAIMRNQKRRESLVSPTNSVRRPSFYAVGSGVR